MRTVNRLKSWVFYHVIIIAANVQALTYVRKKNTHAFGIGDFYLFFLFFNSHLLTDIIDNDGLSNYNWILFNNYVCFVNLMERLLLLREKHIFNTLWLVVDRLLLDGWLLVLIKYWFSLRLLLLLLLLIVHMLLLY